MSHRTSAETGRARAALAGCPRDDSRLLILGGCTQITDAGLRALGAGCPHLTDLNLYNCKQITDAGLRALGAGCPDLTKLTLWTDKTTPDGRLDLEKSRTRLTIINDDKVAADAASLVKDFRKRQKRLATLQKRKNRTGVKRADE